MQTELSSEEIYYEAKAEVAKSIEDAFNTDDYTTLSKIAEAFAESDDYYNAHWVKELAHQAYLNSWGYDEIVDNELAD